MAARGAIRFLKKTKTLRTFRSLTSLTALSSPAAPSSRLFIDNAKCLDIKEGEMIESNSKLLVFCPILPAFLAGIIGTAFLEVSYADADETDDQNRPVESSSYFDMEKIASQERQRLEELLRNKGVPRGSYPSYNIAVKGQQVTIKFLIPPACHMSRLIADLVSRLGVKVDEHGGGSRMMLRSWDSAVAWQLTLNHPQKQSDIGKNGQTSEAKGNHEENLCILIFESLITSDNAEIEFIKQGNFTSKELDAVASALKIASGIGDPKRAVDRNPRRYSDRRERRNPLQEPSIEKSVAALEAMGVRVFGLAEPQGVPLNEAVISWDNIAGYDQQKREIEDTIVLALQSPEVYDDIARGTRCKFESNRPRAVLFEGPPGTGKTSCARVIANQAGVPLLYVPLEVVMSKYYGESERLFGQVFSLANELANGAIIFLDEVDSFAGTRDSEMHEATRRILSVLLRQIDGFEQEKRVVVIAATNRKQDLDPALISRFDSMITFGLPDQLTREKIVAQYARHLSKSELSQFGAVTEEMSGRDIRDVCQQAERHWASKIIRGQAPIDKQGCLPPIQEYIESAEHRRKALFDISERKNFTDSHLKKQPLAFA